MADKKITELAENTAPIETDIFPMVDDPGGSPVTQKVTRQNLLKLVAAPPNDKVSGITITLTAHENVALGDACYINADGEAQIVDADAIATSGVQMIAAETITANNPGLFLLYGVAHLHTLAPAWTVGGLVYITETGTTGNTLSQTPEAQTDEVIQIVGKALAADILLFTPSLSQVEHV
jgi:hypothetical protein